MISSAPPSFQADDPAYDFSAADCALHPDRDGVEDVDECEFDNILSAFVRAGLSHDVGLALLDTATEVVADVVGPASCDAVKLLDTKAEQHRAGPDRPVPR